MHSLAQTAKPVEAAGFRNLRPFQRPAIRRSTQFPTAWSPRAAQAQRRGVLSAATGTAVLAAAWSGVRRGRRSAWGRSPISLTRAAAATEAAVPKPVPVILLSGFLGTGKTTLLRHWLENSTERVGIVVNDVAAVNIDSKLVQQETYNTEGEVNAIQLQNGCACCTLGDELLVDIYDLLELASGDRPFSQIVVELSGIAEPSRVLENFAAAKESGYYVVNGVEMNKVVTLLDASTFCEEYMEFSKLYEREDLIDDRDGNISEMAELAVVELLVEQTEAADVVVLNKTDLATKEQLDATRAVVRAINKKAAIIETTFGKATLSDVLEAAQHAEAGHDHNDSSLEEHGHEEHGHAAHEEQGHEEHGHAEHSSRGGHEDAHAEHGHGEVHGHDHEDHGHAHSHASNDSGHSHSNNCSDPDCTDSSHGHDHSHSHSHSTTTAEERFGITSFTYNARRPLSEERFTQALQKWPIPKHGDLQLLLNDDESSGDHPMGGVIRSKGFCWLETQPSNRVYWSHAGKDMQLTYNGLWWGAMSKEQIQIMEQMGAAGEYARARREDWDDEWGDRRQELVFIGQRLDEASIRALLDSCLLTDEEMVSYKKKQKAGGFGGNLPQMSDAM